MKLRKLIAILAAVLMLASMMPLTAFAEMGGDFPWTGDSDKMLIEEILERDGLIDGIWMPWFNEGQTGHNLTGNEIMAKYNSSSTKDWNRVELDYYGADKIYREIYNLKAMGYNIMAYGGSIFAEGVVFDENGDVIGIKEEYLNNARRLLNMCREIGMPVMWNIYFHSSSMPSYYGIEGWHFVTQMLGNPDVADNYAEKFVRPLCQMLAEYPDVVALVSIADEPENEINDLGKGDHFPTNGREMYGVTHEDMIYFMQQINEVAREELPGVARTVASNNGNKTIYRDFDLDLMGHNQYTDGNTFKSVESLLTDADPILTEYNVGNKIANDTDYANKLITFRQWMMANGYKGGFQWCWTPGQYSGAYALQRNASGTAFRKTVALLRYYMDEYRAAYRGETITLDAPVLYANAGDGKVLFIPSKRATKITVQRSDDGGNTWKSLVTNVAQSTYVNSTYLIGTYTDSTTRPTSGYCYRIIASDDNGNTVTSAPNDLAGTDKTFKKTFVAPTYVPGEWYITSSLKQTDAKLTSFGTDKNRPLSDSVNLIQNGSFESTGGQWNNANFLSYAQVVSDSTAPDGSKSLYVNTDASANGWYTFTVSGLKANTEYTFSTFIKGAYLADDNKGNASIGVIDPDTGKFMFYWEYFRSYPRSSRETKQLYPTAYDNDWHIRSVTFNSGDMTTATIALYGASSKIWLDGLALFETTQGVKYDNGESSKAITSTTYNPASGATNAVADPAVNNAAYWNTGAGYKQGFMSIASGKLKYTASSDPKGVRYTKWIDVKPGTDYYVSYTVNVTTAGNGRVAILDDAKLLPFENLTTSFSSTGTKTVTGRISTGKYDQLGLCVVDLGGVATIDNIYLYEGGESVVIPTTPSFDGYITNGDFEVGSSTGWENLWNNNTVELVDGRDSLFALKGTAGGSYTQVRQKITVEKNTDYVIEVWAKNVNGTTLIVKDSADANLKQTGLQGSGSTWTKTVLEFNSGNHEFIYLGFMGSSAGKTWTIDDVKMYKKVTESNDGYLVNGDFETGISNPWENLWGSNTVTIVDGHDSNYGMKVNAGQYTVVRQKVTVEKNTDYVITLWSKDSVNGSLLIKDSADSQNIINQSLNTSSTWKQVTVEFNSGNNEFVYVGFMGGAAGSTYTVDDVVMTKKEAPAPVFGVVNGGFENGKDGWTFGSGTNALVTDAHSGNNAIQLTNPGKWASAAEQTIAVEPNTSYTITWWYKATPGTGVFNLYVMNASGYANLSSTGGKNYMNNFTGGWEKGTYVVNSGSAEAIILKFSTEASNPGTIIVDDVAIEKTAAHTHEYVGTVTKQPTCGATGVKTYTCSCGEGTYTETIPATGAHAYDNACDTSCNVCGATRTVSHSYSGACDQYCNLCGAKKTGLSVGNPHTYDNACDADCNVCGEIRSVAGHTYDNACDTDCNTCGAVRQASHSYKTVVTAPDCVNGGYTTYTCTVCGDSYKGNYTDALGHDWIAADCDTAKTCRTCGATEGDALGHSYKTVVTAPDCVNGGYTTYTCTVCGDSYKGNYTDALGHDWIAADCDTAKTCRTCGATEGDALGHSYKTVVTAPDCVNGGYTTYTCTACGNSYKSNYTDALGHDWIAADCDTAKTCGVCGATEGAALGHSYKTVVTAPDCVNGGYTTYTCTACGDSYKDNYTDALGHDWVDATCTAPKTCSVCGATEGEALGHSYDNEYDVDCNACGAIREVEMPIASGGNSISEDVSGLAFKFTVDVIGMTVDKTTAIYENATIGGNKLLSMGAVASNNGSVPTMETVNGDTVVDIPAVYLCNLTETSASYAVRIIDIPSQYYFTVITVRPYLILNVDDVEIVVYGDIVASSFNEAYGPHTHEYADATCTTPATCPCGVTTGDALGHSYTLGECVVCGDYSESYIPKLYLTGDMAGMTQKEDVREVTFEYRSKDQMFTGAAKVKIQGNTSAHYPKKNYNITLYKDETFEKKQKINVGWGSESKYCLKANYIDQTHTRNVVSAKLAGQIQNHYGLLMDAPNNGAVDGFPIEVYIDGSFHGLYTMNIPKDEWTFAMDKDNPNHIVMGGGNNSDAVKFRDENIPTDFSDWEVEVGPENEETLQKFQRLYTFIRDSSDEEFKANFDQYLDFDSTLNYYAVIQYGWMADNVSKNMMLVTYDGQVWYPSLYDMDTSWGTNYNGTTLYPYEKSFITAWSNLLFERMEKLFKKELAERYFELRATYLDTDYVMTQFSDFYNRIPQEVLDREREKWSNESTPLRGYPLSQIEEFLNSAHITRLDNKYRGWLNA